MKNANFVTLLERLRVSELGEAKEEVAAHQANHRRGRCPLPANSSYGTNPRHALRTMDLQV